ncbi:hypothetical protein VPH35_062136 [Triticum aestivum]
MDKYTIRILAAALLSLHLVCFATVAQCRIIADTGSEKIKAELCVHVTHDQCTPGGECFCCLVNVFCYTTMDECEEDCKKSSSRENILLAMSSPSPLPTP